MYFYPGTSPETSSGSFGFFAPTDIFLFVSLRLRLTALASYSIQVQIIAKTTLICLFEESCSLLF